MVGNKGMFEAPFEYIVHKDAQLSGNKGKTWNGEEDCELGHEFLEDERCKRKLVEDNDAEQINMLQDGG